MSLTDPVEQLKQLGLTEYEVQAYLTLIHGTQMTAEEVARKARIPVPRVYGVLENLKGLGLIAILQGRPKKFEIISPDEGLQHLLEIRRQTAEDSLQQLEKTCQEVKLVLSPVFWRERLRIRPEDLLESIENLALTEKLTKQLITESVSSLNIFTDIFRWFKEVEPDLLRAMKRGVKIRVLMNMEHTTTAKTVNRLQAMGIAVRQPPDLRFPVRGTIADNSRVVFLIWATPERTRKEPRYVYRPSYSANEGIVAIFQQSFEYRWEQGKARKASQ